MPQKRRVEGKQLNAVVADKARSVLAKFSQTALSGVEEGELRSVLESYCSGWKDTVRPALTLLSCEAVGGDVEACDDAGLLFTLFAAGIGIHDDIIDKSTVNHFKKTLPGQIGVDKALLVGDLLMSKAWTLIPELISKHSGRIEPAQLRQIYEAYIVEVCQAEFNEVSCRRKLSTDLECYQNILWQAMAETEVCSKVGAILGNGSNVEVDALAGFGRRLGFMYRLSDDVRDCLNVEGNLAHRIENESVPLPILFTANSSKHAYDEIDAIVQKPSVSAWDVRELLKCCFEAEAFAYMQKIGDKNLRLAANELRRLKATYERTMLSAMLNQSYDDLKNLIL